MPFRINETSRIAPVRDTDAVRIDAPMTADGIGSIALHLADRGPETHCLVALPLLPVPRTAVADAVRLWATAAYADRSSARLPFMVYVVALRGRAVVSEAPVRFFAGPTPSRIVLDLDLPAEADAYQLVLYASREYRGTLVLDDPRLVVGATEHRIGEGVHVSRPVDLGRRWRQDGTRVVCASVYGEHWAEMPAGWRLDAVHPAALAAAEWLIYGAVDRQAFGVRPAPPVPEPGERRAPGRTTLLSYSIGTDSTAAMTLLPDDTIGYYCRRAYDSYLSATGAEIALPSPEPWERRLAGLGNVIPIPTTFEQVRLAGGGRHGFAHNFGYAAIGLLLADHLDAGVLAFGSVLEQVFLRSGNLFADVVAIPGSSFHSLRRPLEAAGLFTALPTAGCSEVLTSRISDTGRFAGVAISCPRPGPGGAPCGTCFKCFRKLRIEGRADVPPPDPGVLKLLEKYPLKSATSVVYGAQRAGFRHPALDAYEDVELDLLERYFDYAIDHMLPPHLREHARRQLAALGIEPMTDEDDLRLRTIGQVFWPEEFSWSRAGISEPPPP